MRLYPVPGYWIVCARCRLAMFVAPWPEQGVRLGDTDHIHCLDEDATPLTSDDAHD